MQARAIELSPSSASLKLCLARIQLQYGDKTKARAFMEELKASGDKFPGQSEVMPLIKSAQ